MQQASFGKSGILAVTFSAQSGLAVSVANQGAELGGRHATFTVGTRLHPSVIRNQAGITALIPLLCSVKFVLRERSRVRERMRHKVPGLGPSLRGGTPRLSVVIWCWGARRLSKGSRSGVRHVRREHSGMCPPCESARRSRCHSFCRWRAHPPHDAALSWVRLTLVFPLVQGRLPRQGGSRHARERVRRPCELPSEAVWCGGSECIAWLPEKTPDASPSRAPVLCLCLYCPREHHARVFHVSACERLAKPGAITGDASPDVGW